MRRLVGPVLAASLLALTGCNGDDEGGAEPDALGTPSESPQPNTRTATVSPAPAPDVQKPEVVRTVATGLAAPWGVTFLPDGTALVGERDTTRVVAVSGGGRGSADVRPVGVVDIADPQGEAGLLGLAASPSYDEDRLVYAYVSTSEDNRVVRMTYDGRRLGEPEPVLTGIPNGFIHDGGRLLFADDGTLFVSTGETGEEQLAQDPDSLAGKVLHITADGDPAPDNPVDGITGVDARSPQRAGPGVRRRRTALGQRVRLEHLGRAEPHREEPQLRLAARGGQGRPRRVPQPVRHLGHLRRLSLRAGLPRRLAVDGRAAWRAPLAGPRDRRGHRRPPGLVRR